MSVPVAGLFVTTAYQPATVRDADAELPPPPQPAASPLADTVIISEAARKLAEKAEPDIVLWGEVRFDPPHHDDPDLPWEIQHQEWMKLVEKVFGESAPATPASGEGS